MTALKISGMSCQNCARHARDALAAVPGVAAVEILLDAGEARVQWNGKQEEPLLLAALKKAGYPGSVIDLIQKKIVSAGAVWRLNIIIGLAGTLPLFIGEWGFHLHSQSWFGCLGLLLIFPVQCFAGARFYKGAWEQLKIGHSNMDTLVSLGSTAAFAYSVYGLFSGTHPLYFMEAGAILTLISIGHYLEARMSEKAAVAVKSLLKLAPETAVRLKANGNRETVPVNV